MAGQGVDAADTAAAGIDTASGADNGVEFVSTAAAGSDTLSPAVGGFGSTDTDPDCPRMLEASRSVGFCGALHERLVLWIVPRLDTR